MTQKDEKTKDQTKRAVLINVTPGMPEELIKLRRDATIFGRDKADIVIEDKEISATHCQIQNISEVYHLFDMNSTNGTFVNGQRIVKAKLKEGDVLTIGKTSFKFALEDEKSVRHLATIFRSKKSNSKDKNASVIDTLIHNELAKTSQSIVIDVTYGNGENERIEIRQNLLYIGRASSFGKFDEDTEISRKHLMIKLNDTGEIFVEDQGSTNGSFLNGQKLQGMQSVKDSDEIKIGACLLRVWAV